MSVGAGRLKNMVQREGHSSEGLLCLTSPLIPEGEMCEKCKSDLRCIVWTLNHESLTTPHGRQVNIIVRRLSASPHPPISGGELCERWKSDLSCFVWTLNATDQQDETKGSQVDIMVKGRFG